MGKGQGNVPVIRLLGTYEDSYVRENGRWRFRTRIAQTNIPHKELELPAAWGQDAQAAAPAATDSEEMVEAMPSSGLLARAPGDDSHVIVNPLIELDPDDPDLARAELTWLYVVKGPDGGPKPAKLGHYNDTLIREAGRWRFLRREAPADIG